MRPEVREPRGLWEPSRQENNEPWRVRLGREGRPGAPLFHPPHFLGTDLLQKFKQPAGGLPTGQGVGPPLDGVPAQCLDDRVDLPLVRKDEEDGAVAHVVQLHQLAGEHRVIEVVDVVRLEHHGHLYQGRLVHIEVLLFGACQVEGVCPRAWEEGGQEIGL